jgi:salicylate hydroxylase
VLLAIKTDTASGKGQYTTVGAYEDGRSAEELEKEVSWDQHGNVQFLREKYKV